VDVKLSYSRRRYGASVEIFDLFDVQYEHIPRYPMPGRNVRFTLSVSI
jgi:outer membrane cobalamin receptor